MYDSAGPHDVLRASRPRCHALDILQLGFPRTGGTHSDAALAHPAYKLTALEALLDSVLVRTWNETVAPFAITQPHSSGQIPHVDILAHKMRSPLHPIKHLFEGGTSFFYATAQIQLL